MPGIQKILHPTDFSENARYAFRVGLRPGPGQPRDIARSSRHDALCRAALDQPLPDPLRPAESQPSGASLPWPQAADPQIHVEHRLTEGDPAEEVLRLAALLQCDLIVVGTHGRTGLGRLLMGSVAEEVLRKASCPVLVVKTPARETPDAAPETTASPGEPVEVWPRGVSLVSAQTRTLVRTSGLEVVRLIVRAGQEIPQHRSKSTNRCALPGGARGLHCASGKRRRWKPGRSCTCPPASPTRSRASRRFHWCCLRSSARATDQSDTPFTPSLVFRSCSKRSSVAARPARAGRGGGLPGRSASPSAVGCTRDSSPMTGTTPSLPSSSPRPICRPTASPLAPNITSITRMQPSGSARPRPRALRRRSRHVITTASRACRSTRAASFQPSHVAAWIVENQIRTLNVAGSRECEEPGIGEKVEQFLGEVLLHLGQERA